MNKAELAALRRIAERRFNEEVEKRRKDAHEKDNARLAKISKTHPEVKRFRKAYGELKAAAQKLKDDNLRVTAEGRYNSLPLHLAEDELTPSFISDSGSAVDAHQKWQYTTKRAIENMFDQAEIKSAGMEATDLLAKLEELLRG